MEEEYEDVEEKQIDKEFKIRKKYSPKYILMEKMIEVYMAFILFIAVCFSSNHVAYGFFAAFVLVVIVLGVLIISKKNAPVREHFFILQITYHRMPGQARAFCRPCFRECRWEI